MNDDNIRFVHLGGRYARHLAKAGWSDLIVEPFLVTGPAPRLIGQDHAKVSHARGNAYYMRRGPVGIAAYMFHLFNKSSFFRRYPSEHERYCESPRTYAFPDSFAPFSHLCLLFGETKARELWEGMTIQRFRETVELLTVAGEGLLSRFVALRNDLTDEQARESLSSTEHLLEERLILLEERALACGAR